MGDTDAWTLLTIVLLAGVTVPTARPALVMAVPAAACVRPTTLGTVTAGAVTLSVIAEETVRRNSPRKAAETWKRTLPALASLTLNLSV